MRRVAKWTTLLIGILFLVITASCTTPPQPSDAAPQSDIEPVSEPATEEASDSSATPEAESEPEIATIAPDSPWEVTLEELDLAPGDRFELVLPPGGTPAGLWGTYVYTHDSSVGTAAVHAGLISFESGGAVEVEVVEGDPFYLASQMNGVESGNWPEWPVGFTFLEDGKRIFTEPYRTIFWWTDSEDLPLGIDVTLELPPHGNQYDVWGTGTYTSDSSIGTAAVHAGLITLAEGGEVTLRRVDGVDEYEGSTRNGVTTDSYGAYDGAFVFVR